MYTEFDKRMKGYERQFNVALDPNEPVIVRVDGRCFHTFTKNFQKPFDDVLSRTMRDTMQYLCENVQGCVLGYTQSDEISLLLANYLNERAEPFFGYRIQKLCSVIASMATAAFLDRYEANVEDYENEFDELFERYYKHKYVTFDCRAFNIPKEEVTNYFYWRQSDAFRNAVNMIARTHYSDKQLKNKSRDEVIGMLHEKNDYLSNYESHHLLGSCCIKKKVPLIKTAPTLEQSVFARDKWFIDLEIPAFKKEGREYIEKLIRQNGEEV